MEFLNPLWGVFGISVPIIIHLLNRFRFRQVDWAAMELLRRALVVRSRRLRIEDLILLLLRSAAVLLVALAFARPTIRPPVGATGGGGVSVGAVIGLDASFSMDHRPGVGSRFDRAVERVREIGSALPLGSPASLVLLGSRPRILLRSVGYDKKRWDDVLESLRPLPERLNLEPCLEEIGNLIAELKCADRECYLVTDSQASSWERPSERARAQLLELAMKARILYLPVASSGDENIAIVDLERASGAVQEGGILRFVATVQNLGATPRTEVIVRLEIGEAVVDERTLDRIGPGETSEVSLFATLPKAGPLRVVARSSDDPLPLDNERRRVVQVPASLRVLVVDGRPSASPYGSEAAFLATALRAGKARAAGEGASGDVASLSVTTISWRDLAAEQVAAYEAIFLVNVPDIPADEAALLARFVGSGKGIFVSLGDAVEPALLGEHLNGVGLLPAEILGLAESSSAPGPEEDAGRRSISDGTE